MKKTNLILTSLVMAMSASLASCSSASDTGQTFKKNVVERSLSNDSIEKKIDDLYSRMTPGERLAQLQCRYLTDFFDENRQLDTAKCRQLIPNGIGHIPQYAGNSTESPDELRDMVKALQEWLINNTPSGIPAMFHEEVLSGFCAYGSTIYPQQIGQACSFNTDLAAEKTRQTAKVMRKLGGTLSLSPMVDVVRNPFFNRLEESYGEDAYLSAAFGSAFVEGLQDGGLDSGVLTCSKHFLGYGGGGDAPEKELYEEILLPHETMIRGEGSKVVMMGYHQVNDTFCTVNHELMQGILRDYLGFDGMIVSDYGAMDQPLIDGDPLKRAAAAINAGMDVEFPLIGNYARLPEAIEKGLVSEETFERAVKRVLRMKAATGLLDENPTLYGKGHITYDSPEERRTAYDIASQSIVLLKNDGALPLKAPQKIALVGPNADSMWAMLGDYTYPSMQLFWRGIDTGNPGNQTPSLRECMESKLPAGCEMAYTAGCDWTEPAAKTTAGGGDERARWLDNTRRIERPDEEFDEAKAIELATNSDVVIAAVGENIFLCGENRDRGSVKLPGKQEEFVRKLIATGKPVVLVMFGGRALVIGDLADKCAAVVHAWYPGEEGGNAVADILYGNVNPSAKLSVSYPKEEINEAVCYNTSVSTDPRMQWPFGYGLSYTTYDYSNLKVDDKAATDSELFNISVDVTNSGNTAGEEIVQLYVSPTDPTQQLKPIKLAGFARVALNPGETKTMRFIMSPQQLGHWADRQWHILPGDYVIKAGASSADIRAQQTITLTGDEVTMPLRSVYFTEAID